MNKMATGGCDDTSDEIFNFKCTPCSKANKNREAVKYCVECQGYCCKACTDLHNVFPALEGHQLLDKSDFKATGITSDLPDIPTVRCRVHRVKVVDMYCGNHDVVGCTSCMALTHRSCTDVQLVPDIINTVFKRTDADTTTLELQERIKQLQEIVNTRMALLKELIKSKTGALTEIANFRKEIEVFLKNLEKESVNEVEEEYRIKWSMLEEEKKEAENEIEIMKQAETDLQQPEANKAQTFVCMKIALGKVTSADEVIDSLKTHSNAHIKFQVDEDVRDTFYRFKSFGKLNIRFSEALEPRTSVYSVAGTSETNIKSKSDTSICHIFGSCITQTGMLLLTDTNNKKLKRTYVTNLSTMDECGFPYTPHFVCDTDKQEAALSFYNNTIEFVSLGNKLTRTRRLNLGHRCLGIAYKAGKLYITDSSSSLYIHDMAGNTLHTVSQDSSGNPLFTGSRQIAFSDSGDKMFVVDWNNRMTTLDLNGKHIDTVTYSSLDEASGVETDRRGNVFACGYRTNNIVQIGQDGEKKGVIATASDGLVKPLSICFDSNQNVLFVTQASSDKVKVFYLK